MALILSQNSFVCEGDNWVTKSSHTSKSQSRDARSYCISNFGGCFLRPYLSVTPLVTKSHRIMEIMSQEHLHLYSIIDNYFLQFYSLSESNSHLHIFDWKQEYFIPIILFWISFMIHFSSIFFLCKLNDFGDFSSLTAQIGYISSSLEHILKQIEDSVTRSQHYWLVSTSSVV